ncbi:MAG: hypothetical protein ACW99F_18975, partial [Candidatus Hodarchaeales archaeon]
MYVISQVTVGGKLENKSFITHYYIIIYEFCEGLYKNFKKRRKEMQYRDNLKTLSFKSGSDGTDR